MTGTSQQPLLVTATARPPMDEHQSLPPRSTGASLGGNQQQIMPTQVVRQQDHQHIGSTNLYVLRLI